MSMSPTLKKRLERTMRQERFSDLHDLMDAMSETPKSIETLSQEADISEERIVEILDKVVGRHVIYREGGWRLSQFKFSGCGRSVQRIKEVQDCIGREEGVEDV